MNADLFSLRSEMIREENPNVFKNENLGEAGGAIKSGKVLDVSLENLEEHSDLWCEWFIARTTSRLCKGTCRLHFG